MAKEVKRESYDTRRVDYNNPPEGKTFFPRVLEDDVDVNASEDNIQFAANGSHIVMRMFSMTLLPTVMELVDDTPENQEAKKAYIRMIGTLCKQRERRNSDDASPEMAAPISLDKLDEETGEPEINPASSDNTEAAIIYAETRDELNADLKEAGDNFYEISEMRKTGYKQTEISEKLGIPTSTVCDRVKAIDKITETHRKEVLR